MNNKSTHHNQFCWLQGTCSSDVRRSVLQPYIHPFREKSFSGDQPFLMRLPSQSDIHTSSRTLPHGISIRNVNVTICSLEHCTKLALCSLFSPATAFHMQDYSDDRNYLNSATETRVSVCSANNNERYALQSCNCN